VTSIRKTARMAGLLYLPVVLAGPFVLLYVPKRIFVDGDATATAANILAHETLFRISITVGIVSELLFVSTVLALHELLKGVGRRLAILMVIPILIDASLAFQSSGNELAAVSLLRKADALGVFEKPQRDFLATFLLDADRKGVFVSEVFWGIWLLPLGILVYRSRFLPGFLGVWLFANGIAYVLMSLTGLLEPDSYGTVSTWVTPLLFGEMALMLWLVIRGARGEPQPARTGS